MILAAGNSPYLVVQVLMHAALRPYGSYTRELFATHLGCKICQLKGQGKRAGRCSGWSSPAIYDELSAVIVGQGKDQLQSIQYDACCVFCSCLLG